VLVMPLCRRLHCSASPLLAGSWAEEVAVRGEGVRHGWRSVSWVRGWSVISWLGGWVVCLFLQRLSGLGDRRLCCQTLPALLSVEDWSKALASARQGRCHQELFSGSYDVCRWSAHFPGPGVSVAAVVGAHGHVAALQAQRWNEGTLEAELLSRCC